MLKASFIHLHVELAVPLLPLCLHLLDEQPHEGVDLELNPIIVRLHGVVEEDVGLPDEVVVGEFAVGRDLVGVVPLIVVIGENYVFI